jgi:hypothetical protein
MLEPAPNARPSLNVWAKEGLAGATSFFIGAIAFFVDT